MTNTKVLGATNLIGREVQNLAGETLGRIEDVVVHLDSGTVDSAVVSVGGFLGLGNRHLIIPWDHLGIEVDATEVVTDIDSDVLNNAPTSDRDEWSDSTDSVYLDHLYHRSSPYWTGLK